MPDRGVEPPLPDGSPHRVFPKRIRIFEADASGWFMRSEMQRYADRCWKR